MSSIIQLIVRHLLALCGGWFAAHHITGDSTTSIVVGVAVVGIPVVWSVIAKWLHLDDKLVEDISGSQMLRVALGSLVSQGITALSAYFAVDANNPELLGVAVINAGLSKAGLHQKLALAGSVTVVKVLMLCGCVLALSSCATSSALIASPFGRALMATADQLGKAVIETTQKVGLEQIILQASAKVSELKAEGIHADPVKEILRGSQISAFADVIEAAQAKYQQLTGKRFTLPKNPINVLAVTAFQNRLKPGLQNSDTPACLLSLSELRHAVTAAHDAQGDPAMPPPPLPAMKQSASGVSIPLLGRAVAMHLASPN